MSKLIKTDNEYKSWIGDLKLRIRQSQIKAAVKVNIELIRMYWELGKDIVEMQSESKWGGGFFKELSQDLKDAFPDMEGFSVSNLKYMKRMYLSYNQSNTIRQQVADELQERLFSIPWWHHIILISKCKSVDEALFYIRKIMEHGWSRNMLLNILSTDLYQREGKAVSNFASRLPPPQSDLAQEITKDPYNFDFLTLRSGYLERELEDALVTNISKLGFYVSAVNHQMRREGDNPTIGLLVCKNKNEVIARYTLENTTQPIGISEYELTELYPKDMKSSLPSIQDIENELKEE